MRQRGEAVKSDMKPMRKQHICSKKRGEGKNGGFCLWGGIIEPSRADCRWQVWHLNVEHPAAPAQSVYESLLSIWNIQESSTSFCISLGSNGQETEMEENTAVSLLYLWGPNSTWKSEDSSHHNGFSQLSNLSQFEYISSALFLWSRFSQTFVVTALSQTLDWSGCIRAAWEICVGQDQRVRTCWTFFHTKS